LSAVAWAASRVALAGDEELLPARVRLLFIKPTPVTATSRTAISNRVNDCQAGKWNRLVALASLRVFRMFMRETPPVSRDREKTGWWAICFGLSSTNKHAIAT